MKFFVTGVGGQLGHDVMNELSSRGHEGVGSDIAPSYSGIAEGTPVTTMPYVQRDVADKEAVAKVALKGSDLHYLRRLSDEFGVNIHAFSEKYGLITPKNSKYTEVEAEINNIKINEMNIDNICDDEVMIKIMMIDEPEVLEVAMNKLPKEVYEKYTVVRSTPYFLEFLNKKVNKGVGVELLAQHLSLSKEEVMTFGDAGNDIHMIEYAGLGIAMENAFDEVKEVANYITKSNEDDGVAKAIEKFILKQ